MNVRAAPLGAELSEEAATRIRCDVIQGYGMTEFELPSYDTTGTPPGSVGVTVPNSECRRWPETGQDKGR